MHAVAEITSTIPPGIATFLLTSETTSGEIIGQLRRSGAIAQAVLVAGEVDAILLDSGNPTLAVKELGGTGRPHDWAISRALTAGALDVTRLASFIQAVTDCLSP